MKTVCVALVLALNIGVDPPDIMKPEPCARMECWLDVRNLQGPKPIEIIGNELQAQYERWQPRARYKQCLDPIVEDVKKLCTSLRRNAKEERVLFHYNGRGVPKPTNNGEIWVFNKVCLFYELSFENIYTFQ
jgi:regulatory associated protein of mTOR